MRILIQQLSGLATLIRTEIKLKNISRVPESAMHSAMTDPMSHVHTAVAGPPDWIGMPKVAGTEPNTPRMEMA
jgi:hypothetical protein